MKYDFIETFTDIDEEFIANAKPIAQKPMELRPEPRSKRSVWKKIAAAAACLAVLAAAGSVIAVKVNSGQIAAPGNSGEAVLPNDGAGEQVKSTVDENLPTVGLDQFYDSIQGISRYLSHNDSEIFDLDDNQVKFNVVNSTETEEVRFFVGVAGEEFGLGDEVSVVAAVENVSDKSIGVLVPYTRDDENGAFSNLTGTHSEIAVEIKNGSLELQDNVETKYFLDDPHILTIEPGETYYQLMSFETYYLKENSELGRKHVDVPSGIYNGTAEVSLVSDSGEVSVHSLDFDINIAEWRACTEFFVNNGMVEKSDFRFFDGRTFLYKKDGIYYNDYEMPVKLYGGEYVQDWYLYDLNGDCSLEIISTVTANPELGDLIYAYDSVDEQLYVLSGFDEYDCRLDRVNGRPVARKFDVNGDEVSVEPLEFDMFKTCIIGKNSEPQVIEIDFDGKTSGVTPMAPIED